MFFQGSFQVGSIVFVRIDFFLECGKLHVLSVVEFGIFLLRDYDIAIVFCIITYCGGSGNCWLKQC